MTTALDTWWRCRSLNACLVLPVCSQLCHLAAATTAQRGERVHYFDTTNSFSAGRLQQLCDIKEPQVHTCMQYRHIACADCTVVLAKHMLFLLHLTQHATPGCDNNVA